MSLAVIQADCKRALGQLSHLSNDELDVIINNDEKIEEILQNLDQVAFVLPQQNGDLHKFVFVELLERH